MLKRPHSFSEIKGHSWAVEYFTDHLENKTLPQFILMDGEEGLGKTSLADLVAITLVYGFEESEEKSKAIKDVIDNKKSNDNIKKFKMSVEGGKAEAQNVLAEFNMSMSTKGIKVIICDECQGMKDDAQDVLIQDCEYLPKGLYLIFLTTELHRLKNTLKSRAVPMHLQRLKQSDMLTVLKEAAEAKNLEIQGGDSTLSLIASWAECKPRTGLNILSAFSENSKVSSSMVKSFIGYMEVDDVLPIVTSLSGSMTFGLTYISELRISNNLIDVLIEMLKIKQGQPSYKIQLTEMQKVRSSLSSVSEVSLLKFVTKLTSFTTLTKTALISSFLQSHESSERLFMANPTVLEEEKIQKSEEVLPEIQKSVTHAPTFEHLILGGNVINPE
jgi:DNA polymerase III delta prime subunit